MKAKRPVYCLTEGEKTRSIIDLVLIVILGSLYEVEYQLDD